MCVCVSQAFSFLAFLQLPAACALAFAVALAVAFAASCELFVAWGRGAAQYFAAVSEYQLAVYG